MKRLHIYVVAVSLFAVSCDQGNTSGQKIVEEPSIMIDIQGHRGARGIKPENTLEAFNYALEQGVTTLELDVVISKDSMVVVSHEPFMSSAICLNPDSSEIAEEEEKLLNMYEMPYEQIKEYDCGSKENKNFSKQEKLKTYKPLLSQVFELAENYIKINKANPVNYNIEIKSQAETDSIYHPTPEVFTDLVYKTIDGVIPWERITIQSFDFRVLQYINKKYPDIQVALLIYNRQPWKQNVDSLGFAPEIYSCYYELLDAEAVEEITAAGMKVIPWTVNERSEMKELIDMGVHGIITDYPNIAVELIN